VPYEQEEQEMSKQRSRLLSMIGVVAMIVLLRGALPGAIPEGEAKDHNDATLVGTWRARTCFPGFGCDFFSLKTYSAGGTMTEQFVDGPRVSLAIGVWKKIGGRGNFAATNEGLFDTNSDGVFDSRFRVRETIHVLDDDTFTITATSDSLTLDGTALTAPPFPGITIQGTRMKVMRE
jgi:hypothetical protein